LAAVVGAAVVQVVFSDGIHTPGGGRLGGDLPAFWGTARLVLEGRIDAIYDLGAQADVQRAVTGGGFLPFPYTVPVALLYAPLGLLGYTAAHVVHTLIMGACAVVAALLISRLLPSLRPHTVAVVSLTVAFPPLFRAIAGGQNAALSLLLLVAAGWLLHRGREVAAGVVAGLWLYKPQLAVFLLLYLLVGRRWRALTSAAAVSGGWYLIGAAAAGWGWPAVWLRDGVGAWEARQATIDAGGHASLLGLARTLGWLHPVAFAAILVASLAVAAAMVSWRRSDNVVVDIAVVGVVILIASPHVLWYELALALPAWGLIAARLRHRASRGLAALFVPATAAAIGIPYVALTVAPATAVWLWRTEREATIRTVAPAGPSRIARSGRETGGRITRRLGTVRSRPQPRP
jgi:hypothetical protein